MSKGFGAVQRRVLAEIARLGSADTFQLAVAVFELKPSKGGATYLTAAQLGSVRRAALGKTRLRIPRCAGVTT